MNTRAANALFVTALGILVLLIYGQVINHYFIWDTNHIFINPELRSITLSHLQWVLVHPVIANWHPVTWVSHMIDYSLFGPESGYHHLVNVLFHYLNSILVFVLVRELCQIRCEKQALLIAMCSAILFAVHPLKVESVAWVAARKDLLYSLFYLAAIILYLRYRSGSRRAYGWSLVLFVMSLLSKSMAVTLPAVLLLTDLYLCREPGFWRALMQTLRHRLVDKLPFLLLSCLVAYITLQTQSDAIGDDKLTLLQQVRISIHNSVFYLQKFLAPVHLSPFYPFPAGGNVDNTEFWFPALIVLIGLTLITLFVAIRITPVPFICWTLYLTSLLPASGIIHVGSAASADRYTYLPMLPVALLFVAAPVLIAARLRAARSVIYGLLGSWFLGLAVLSYHQVGIWATPLTFWGQVLHEFPDTPIAHRNIATAYYLIGDYSEAISHLEHLDEQGWPVKRELVAAYLGKGLCEAARASFEYITPVNEEDAEDLSVVRTAIEQCHSSLETTEP